MAVKKSDWRPNIFVKGSEQTPHQAAQHTRQVKFGNPQKKLCNTLINLQQLGSSLVCRAIGGRSWGVMPFKVHGLTQEFRALHTYSVITNSLHIHKLGVVRWGGGGWSGPWSAGLMPQEQSGFSVLLKVTATTDMYAHWQSNHWAPLLQKWLD